MLIPVLGSDIRADQLNHCVITRTTPTLGEARTATSSAIATTLLHETKALPSIEQQR
jgi:hypothetical protein